VSLVCLWPCLQTAMTGPLDGADEAMTLAVKSNSSIPTCSSSSDCHGSYMNCCASDKPGKFYCLYSPGKPYTDSCKKPYNTKSTVEASAGELNGAEPAMTGPLVGHEEAMTLAVKSNSSIPTCSSSSDCHGSYMNCCASDKPGKFYCLYSPGKPYTDSCKKPYNTKSTVEASAGELNGAEPAMTGPLDGPEEAMTLAVKSNSSIPTCSSSSDCHGSYMNCCASDKPGKFYCLYSPGKPYTDSCKKPYNTKSTVEASSGELNGADVDEYVMV